MPRLSCPRCGASLKISSSTLGMQVRCPACGGSISTLQRSTVEAITAKEPGVPPWVWAFFVAAGLAFLLFLGHLFLGGDSWERDNRLAINEMNNDAVQMVQNGDLEGGVAKYQEMFSFVGPRLDTIRSDDLRQLLADAAKRQSDAQAMLLAKQQSDRMKQADRELQVGEYQPAAKHYSEVLDAIRDGGPPHGPTQRLAEQAATGRQMAQQRMAEAELRPAPSEADQIGTDLPSQNPSASQTHATVFGKVQLVTDDGKPAPLIHLRVCLLRPEVNQEAMVRLYDGMAQTAQTMAADCRKQEQRELALAAGDPTSPHKQQADELHKKAQRLDAMAERMGWLKKQSNGPAELAATYWRLSVPWSQIFDSSRAPFGDILDPVLDSTSTTQTQTGSDGKFEFDDVAGGNYYLYAYAHEKDRIVEWLLPLSLTSSDAVTRDLTMGNVTALQMIPPPPAVTGSP